MSMESRGLEESLSESICGAFHVHYYDKAGRNRYRQWRCGTHLFYESRGALIWADIDANHRIAVLVRNRTWTMPRLSSSENGIIFVIRMKLPASKDYLVACAISNETWNLVLMTSALIPLLYRFQ